MIWQRRELTLRFSVNWLLLIVILAAALIVGFAVLGDRWRPLLVFAASVIAGASALLTAANALDARLAQLQQDRARVAVEFICRWNDPTFFYAKRSGRETLAKLRTLKTPEEKLAYVEEDPTRLANLLDMLNFFECLSIAVQTGVAEEDTARRFFRSISVEYWHAVEDFVRKRRAERQNTRLSQEMEWLFNRWKT